MCRIARFIQILKTRVKTVAENCIKLYSLFNFFVKELKFSVWKKSRNYYLLVNLDFAKSQIFKFALKLNANKPEAITLKLHKMPQYAILKYVTVSQN